MVRLFTFAMSHFSEKARWALDLGGVHYTERPLLPGAHLPVIRRRAPESTVPLLEHDGVFVQGSSAILDYIETALGVSLLSPPQAAEARSAELEGLADRAFGRGVQAIFYEALLRFPQSVIDLWSQDGPWWGRAFYKLLFPVARSAVQRKYIGPPASVAQAKERFRDAVTEVDRALDSGGRRYLTSEDGPRRADVAVASLFAPVCRPPEHPLRWPDLDKSPAGAAIQDFTRQFEGGPTWEFVRRMYRDHRRPAR
jgi:glutathione S-transferase